ncbi:PREDICTED: DNA topoisomerase 2-binding protein 1 isoform X1 [Ipomoea nil]|uniref:DNA topoisomerase 2-binding protein 1 isoform X1 n=1 Tax=Ipomoea nil TaxID=35883 RepID=UPI000900C70E|nr:PREDICTED: DNA topoisomerase 2-binding protein 1 isoform X1 [Ipomoea nil]
MIMAKVFKGANVFMSRNLVPPEHFDALHDALKLNGAQVFLCCDPSRNAPDDYHIISSIDHEKFEDLRSKKCNLIGPQCVLFCAKEQRPLPNQGFTCCLAMDGVKILASGFEADEKVEIKKLVEAMGGVLQAKASMDVNFVIVKNVLAAKYRWAVNVLKKPIVSINWLHQCWKEHRFVPHESFRVHPFSGLTISVTRIPADERKEVEKIVLQNGGKYSPELTKACTHLICPAPVGDKYNVAKSWGHIRIVTKRWLDQSVARGACLNEESYRIQGSSASMNSVRIKNRHSLENVIESVQSMSTATVSNSHAVDSDMGATDCQNTSSFSGAPFFSKGDESDAPTEQQKNNTNFDGCVAGDSQTDDNDLYLSDCRLLILGFSAPEMRKLVNMVRKGGGSRYMSFSDKLTHIIVGSPSEIETKEIRNLAALGVIHVVKPDWLADCISEKKEVPVLRKHIANDLLFPRASVAVVKQGKSNENVQHYKNFGSGNLLEKRKEVENIKNKGASQIEKGSLQPQFCTLNSKEERKMQASSSTAAEDKKSSIVFKGKRFCFSSSFPANQRADIIGWVNQGGGELVEDQIQRDVHFTIECHGAVPSQTDAARVTYVSSHWIKSCLEDGHLLDVGSHIIYSPLPCQVPFPAFKGFRLCVSQYDVKERQLLRNLCVVLGAKFVEKLTTRVTHLLCKFTSGPKYDAACKLRIQPVTCEWIYECIKQNTIVAPDPFYPKEVTTEDREAGICTTSQFPTQAVQMISEDNVSQLQNQSKEINSVNSEAFTARSSAREEMKYLPSSSKKARLLADEKLKCPLSSLSNQSDAISGANPPNNRRMESTKDCAIMTDVANLIEDCLEQTSKNHNPKSPSRNGCDKDLFTSECTILGQDHAEPQSALRLSEHWTNRYFLPELFTVMNWTISMSSTFTLWFSLFTSDLIKRTTLNLFMKMYLLLPFTMDLAIPKQSLRWLVMRKICPVCK